MKHKPLTAGEVYINAIGCATPEVTVTQGQAIEFLNRHYGSRLTARSLDLIQKIFAHPAISRRHVACADLNELVQESADARVARFTAESVRLAARAARQAIAETSHSTGDICALVVNTCTGYICPGLSTYLAEELGLRPAAKLFDLVGSGCGGAIPNLQVAESFLPESDGGIVVSISVEICSATFQVGNDVSLIVSNALFGDGAAAAVLSRRAEGWRLVHSTSTTRPLYREAIRYIHKNGELHNQLAKEVPEFASAIVPEVVEDLLVSCRVPRHEIKHWALHPGGDKVLNALQQGLGLTDTQMAPSRHILRNFGNMSSPTVWFILESVAEQAGPDEYCLMAAFGAGFSAHACLLQRCGKKLSVRFSAAERRKSPGNRVMDLPEKFSG